MTALLFGGRGPHGMVMMRSPGSGNGSKSVCMQRMYVLTACKTQGLHLGLDVVCMSSLLRASVHCNSAGTLQTKPHLYLCFTSGLCDSVRKNQLVAASCKRLKCAVLCVHATLTTCLNVCMSGCLLSTSEVLQPYAHRRIAVAHLQAC